MERLRKIKCHLYSYREEEKSHTSRINALAVSSARAITPDELELIHKLQAGEISGKAADKFPSELPEDGSYDISKHLLGPFRDEVKFPQGWIDVFAEYQKSDALGRSHVKISEWQMEYAQSLSANIVIPNLSLRKEDDVGATLVPTKRLEVIIADPEDARRIARVHVRKQPNLTTGNYNSIISTTDNEYWFKQREEFIPAFLPGASLEQIFKTSAARAAVCSNLLSKLQEEHKSVVDMSDFFLHETQAQLQLALFGETEEFMNATNDPFRYAMAGETSAAYVRPFCRELVARMENGNQTLPAPKEDVAAGKCPVVHGPLSATYREFDDKRPKNAEGNALIFAFAGHDTTGHTLTWLTMELARNKDIQERLRAEVDAFWATLRGREPEYKDLQLLPFMTRCIVETLRLWPAVANGTFREIQFDDHIKGPNGKDVLIKKGTYVRIVNWSRHRNPELWGSDVTMFNPDREFRDEEIWHGEPFKGYNPATERFSPFTFPPRGCIGMNFAQAEARIIMANLLRDFVFEWTPEFESKFDPASYFGVNYGTLGPVDITKPPLVKGFPGFTPRVKPPMGLPLKVLTRR